MTTTTDPCAGCSLRASDGTYSWDCLGCKRWHSDQYRRDDCPAKVGCGQWPTCAGCAYAGQGLSASMLGIAIPPYPMPAPTAPKEKS